MAKREQKKKKLDRRVVRALRGFGLAENEMLVYTEALKHEESSPFSLARATGIPRTTVYDVLTGLSLKGLVELQQSDGYSKQQTRIKAKNPSVMRQILRKRRKELTAVEVDVLEILPILKEDYHGEEPNADFRFYPGVEGARKVLFGEDADGLDLPIMVFDNLMPMDAFGVQDVDEDVDRNKRFREVATTKMRELMVVNDWTKHVVSYQYNRDQSYLTIRNLRYLEHPVLNFNQRLAIKGTRVMCTCVNEDEVWGMVINSRALSEMLAAIFEFMWLQAKPVTDEVVRRWEVVEEKVEWERLYKE